MILIHLVMRGLRPLTFREKTMRAVPFTVTLLLVGILLLSCGQGERIAGTNNQPNSIVPLTLGNYWLYETTTSNRTYISKLGISNTSTTIHDSLEYSVFHWNWYEWPSDEPGEFDYLVRNESDGFWILGVIDKRMGDTLSYVYRTMFIKYPVTAGETWTSVDAIGNPTYHKCVSTSEVLETPAGTFNCIKYSGSYTNPDSSGIQKPDGSLNNVLTDFQSLSDPESLSKTSATDPAYYSYYSPGIGFVGLDDNILGWTKRLSEYHLQEGSQ